MPLLVPPIPFIRRRRRPARATSVAPPAALTRVAAGYEPGVAVTLTFDRAIDIAGLGAGGAGAITVTDEDLEEQFVGTGAGTMLGPAAVRVALAPQFPLAGEPTALTATGGTGIVATDDGGTWAGAAALGLPFP